MLQFLRIQFRLKQITESQLDQLVTDGKITKEDKIFIMG